MDKDTKKNYQLYGRNDMIMLDEHNKIYGSLGMAEPYIVATKEGETLLLDGAKDNEPFIGLSIYGKSHQNTVAGNQLFDASEYVRGGFINEADDEQNGNQSYNCSGFCKLSPQTEYFLSNTGTTSIFYYDVDKAFISFENTSASFTTPDNAEYMRFNFLNTINENNIMLNAGTTALPWEPYTGGQPSPNPDYPQEIEITGKDGEIGVDVYGGNFVLNPEEVVHFEGNIGDGINSIGLSKFIAIVAEAQLLKNDISFSFDSDGGSENNFSFFLRTKCGTEYKYSQNSITLKIINGRNIVEFSKSVFKNLPATGVDELAVQIRPSNPLIDDVNFNITNLMLNIGSTALPFEPYKQPQSLIVSTPNGLPGIPVSFGGNYTDENGKQWVSDEIDFKRGKYVQRVRVLNAMEVSWSKTWDTVFPDESGNTHVFNTTVSDRFRGENAFCTHFRFGDFNNPANGYDLFSTAKGGGDIGVRVSSELASTTEEWKQFIQQNDVIFVCILKNPIETDLTPEQITAYQSLHTNYPTTTVINDEGAGMKAIYKQIENGG